MITGGTIKYGETRKIADFENKRADVELAFIIEDGQFYNDVLTSVQNEARCRCQDMLTKGVETAPKVLPDTIPAYDKADQKWVDIPNPHKVHSKRAPKMPVVPDTMGATEVIERANEAAMLDAAAVPEPPKEQLITVEKVITINGVPFPGEKVITDAELMDATSKHQQQVKNPVGIKKLINDLGVKAPPGRLIDMPQEKRQEYLTKLVEIKPLA